MNKAKTNALDALRALIAERQQYEQWISVLEAKREGTPAHVFEKVNADYDARLDRVAGEIAGHTDELQLSITTLSSRLIEVARDEDMKRDTLQEAELRAAVGEYEPARWEEMRVDVQKELDRIAADRERLDNELTELRSIQTLSAVASPRPKREPPATREPVEGAEPVAAEAAQSPEPAPALVSPPDPAPDTPDVPPATAGRATAGQSTANASSVETPRADKRPAHAEPVAAGSRAPDKSIPSHGKSMPSIDQDVTDGPAVGGAEVFARPIFMPAPPARGPSPKSTKPADSRVEQAKTLKCPECGAPNHPTEWYCERCGGELATM
ncbi:MAG: hypothetical protein ABIR58_05990 [Gemmatimonadaceae bacterium]